MKSEPGEAARRIMDECVECGACQEVCDFLAETDESPAAMAERGVSVHEAYSCNLCGGCEAACPLGLNPGELFAERREQAVANSEIDVDEYWYLLPDCASNGMSMYRDYFGIDYHDLEAQPGSDTGFFPGCTLMTYDPGMTREIFRRLRENGGCYGLFEDCCGKPLQQMGLAARADQALKRLQEKVRQSGIKSMVFACPGCYYRLREPLQEIGVKVRTVYEVLNFTSKAHQDLPLVTVHDSCPDRFEGIFARQARAALQQQGYQLAEMAAHGKESPCCGSGGQVSHFRPERADMLVEKRLKEAGRTGAGILAAYCLSCALNFARKPSRLQVRHVLNLLLDYDADYTGVKDRAAEVFAGGGSDEG